MSESDRGQRTEWVRIALHDQALSGNVVPRLALELCEAYVDGTLSLDELLGRIRAAYDRSTDRQISEI